MGGSVDGLELRLSWGGGCRLRGGVGWVGDGLGLPGGAFGWGSGFGSVAEDGRASFAGGISE